MVHTGLRPRVAGARVPSTSTQPHVTDLAEIKTLPSSTRRQAASASAGKLISQRDFLSLAIAKDHWAKLAREPVVNTKNLFALCHGTGKQAIGLAWHRSCHHVITSKEPSHRIGRWWREPELSIVALRDGTGARRSSTPLGGSAWRVSAALAISQHSPAGRSTGKFWDALEDVTARDLGSMPLSRAVANHPERRYAARADCTAASSAAQRPLSV